MEFKRIKLDDDHIAKNWEDRLGDLSDVTYTNVESLYRAVNTRLNTVYECMRESGVWECVITNFDAQKDEDRQEVSLDLVPETFDTLRECKRWAEFQDYVRMEAAFPTPRAPIHQTHLDLIDAINAYIEAERDHVVECLERDIENQAHTEGLYDGARDAIYRLFMDAALADREIKIPKDPTALNHHDERAGMGIAQGLTEKISRNIRASIALQYRDAHRESFQKP